MNPWVDPPFFRQSQAKRPLNFPANDHTIGWKCTWHWEGIPMKNVSKAVNSNVVQINKQVTIVNVNTRPARRRRRHQHCQPPRAVRCQRVSGRIFQACSDGLQEYFRSLTRSPSALIEIENKSLCKMEAVVHYGDGKTLYQTISRGQQVAIQVPFIRSLQIQCGDDTESLCRGFYTICLS